MYPGNPGGDQVRRNCDWLAGQEVRDGGFICFIYILIAHQGPQISFSGPTTDVLLLPVATSDFKSSLNFHPPRYLLNIKAIN